MRDLLYGSISDVSMEGSNDFHERRSVADLEDNRQLITIFSFECHCILKDLQCYSKAEA